MSAEEFFSIRQMIDLTGLSEFTIRGWENRYLAFQPKRSKTGRRAYSKDDIERALLLRELLKRGQKIGKIAHLKKSTLESIFQETVSDHPALSQVGKSSKIDHILEMVALQRWAELEILVRKVKDRDACSLVHNFFLPILRDVAEKVAAGHLSISQEHILSALLKEKIYSALVDVKNQKRRLRKNEKNRFLLAAPEGDHHDLGLLLAHLLISFYGYPSLYLGPHTPARDLSETALRWEASHLLIVSTVSTVGGAHQDLLNYISAVKKPLASRQQIVLAGAQASQMKGSPGNFISLQDFQDLQDLLISLEGCGG